MQGEGGGESRGRSQLYVILWFSAFGHIGRQQRRRGIKSWEARLKANEAEKPLLQGKQFGMTKMSLAQGLGAAMQLHEREAPRGVQQWGPKIS